ncbi:ATP-binding protein [Lactobacillus crispatus]|uniref:ATP-binding protein n=1 Tax=Lactobacillus crispatus TaxID=47770 RepID=A0A5M9Z095_9LACO|nr:ATP-binding protein [Lactobacillus crispatus]KAA8811937.1 ATP-binding protein [Lactobacillus crispatus]MBW9143677.1 DUF4143 domain-containing protein [Lactobacillus crispatus]ORE80742.1 AAA family ATPase [Lactobacillus crispatus]QWW28705.1 ATP-binding protein [Lactobacillus crispatus]
MTLERIIKFMFDSIGSYLSIRKIANTLTSMGHKITPNTVERYINALLDSLIIYDVSRFDIHGKEQLGSLKKYYIVDTGLIYHLLASHKKDRGHIIENIVYLELLSRGYNVTVGSIPNGEIDFVARKNNEIFYYQVSETVLDEKTLERELKPFNKINDHYPKFLLIMNEFGKNDNFNGIKQLNILDWLLE